MKLPKITNEFYIRPIFHYALVVSFFIGGISFSIQEYNVPLLIALSANACLMYLVPVKK